MINSDSAIVKLKGKAKLGP